MELQKDRLLSFVARKGALVLGATVLILVLRLLKNIIVSRILEPELRGIWGLLSVVPTFLVSAGNLGIGSAITYYTGKKIYSSHYTLGAVFYSTLLFGVGLGFVASWLIGNNLFFSGETSLIEPYRPLIMAITPFFWLQIMVSGYLTGASEVERLTLFRIMESALPLLLFLIFFYLLSMNGLNAATYSWFWGLVAAVCCATLLLPLREAFPFRLSAKACKDFFWFGLRGHLGNFFNLIILRIDILFISHFLPPAALGYYMISTSIAELLLLLPEALVIPFTGSLFGASEKDSADFSRNVLRGVFWAMLGICLVAMLFSYPLLYVMFGSAYLPAWKSTLILIPGMLFLSVFYILKVDMNNKGCPGVTSLCVSVGAAINAVMNYFFIPQYGIEASALASTLCYMICAVLMLVVHCRQNNTNVFRVFSVTRTELALAGSAVCDRARAMLGGKKG